MEKVSAIARCFGAGFGRRVFGCTLFKRNPNPRKCYGEQRVTNGDKKTEHCPLPQCDDAHMRCSRRRDKRPKR
jgi:hypothetical protein